MSNQSVSIYAEALKRQQQEAARPSFKEGSATSTPTRTQRATRDITSPRKVSRGGSRASSRNTARQTSRDSKQRSSRDLPSRDEIQEFSFRLRDELRVKVQAEVPPDWQKDLEEVAHALDVKKLELYRFIIGEFLGKVKRRNAA